MKGLFIGIIAGIIVFFIGAVQGSFLLAFLGIAIIIGAFVMKSVNKAHEKIKIVEQKKEATYETSSAKLAIVNSCYLAGTSFQEENIKKLFEVMKVTGMLEENDDYSTSKKELIEDILIDEDERVYRFETVELACKLEEENDNEYDTNAIKVNVSPNGDDWFFVGYVPKKRNKEVKEKLNNSTFVVEWKGDKYKKMTSDEEIETIDGHSFELIWKES